MTHKFATGDLVRVVTRVEKEDGWDNVWVPPMTNLLGSEQKVRQVDERGVELDWYFFPPSSLELVKSHEAVTEVI